MVTDAENNAASDKARREGIEKKNNLDSMIYQAEKTLGENSDALSDDEKKDLTGVLEEAKTELASEDTARIDAALQKVESALHKVAEKLYKAQADAGAGEGGPGSAESAEAAPPDDDVIDAEFTEEKPEA